jgi:RNA polymerase sigma-70 factor (ECF subfamily)
MKNNSLHPTAELYIDEETMALLKARDPLFLAALFTEINPYLIRVCAASGVVDENMKEVIHDTWERFFTNLEKFEGRSQIRTFICGILFNKLREYRRFQGKIIYEEDSEKIASHAFTVDGWWSTAPKSPHKIAELKQSSGFIRDCLEGLSEQQKAAFVMREIHEENSQDVCETLGVNLSHLRVLLFRAKDKLRKCLEGKVAVEDV